MAVELCIEQLGKQPVPELWTFLEHCRRAEGRTKVRDSILTSNGDLGGRKGSGEKGGGRRCEKER